MTNKEVARCFSELASLMELYNENPFKIKSYSNAYLVLRKLDTELNSISEEELDQLPGIGKAIASKIKELITTGKMETLEKYRSITPEGVRELLKVNGLGPKKIEAIWKKLDITTPGELLYACNENRLIELSGFGTKTQNDIKSRLEFYFNASGKYLYPRVTESLTPVIEAINQLFSDIRLGFCGQIRRMCQVIDAITLVAIRHQKLVSLLATYGEITKANAEEILFKMENGMEVMVHCVPESEYALKMLEFTGPHQFNDPVINRMNLKTGAKSEEELFKMNGLKYFPAVLRDNDKLVEDYLEGKSIPEIIELKDLKGIIHNHSTWSDGIHSLEEMALHVMDTGFKYFVISDHSKSAVYANGLGIDRVEEQWKEIDRLNLEISNFKIFKGIESDILTDGHLDYPEEILKGFDLVIASVHSNINMDETKAMKRLISAIENPFTRILGHPTGRLLLARTGYPVNHKWLIDACAANNVVIELNANPHRLDLDWSWIPYASEKGVKISINPDAHSKSGINDIIYGVNAAQKGGLTKDNCLNTMTLTEFEAWLHSK